MHLYGQDIFSASGDARAKGTAAAPRPLPEIEHYTDSLPFKRWVARRNSSLSDIERRGVLRLRDAHGACVLRRTHERIAA